MTFVLNVITGDNTNLIWRCLLIIYSIYIILILGAVRGGRIFHSYLLCLILPAGSEASDIAAWPETSLGPLRPLISWVKSNRTFKKREWAIRQHYWLLSQWYTVIICIVNKTKESKDGFEPLHHPWFHWQLVHWKFPSSNLEFVRWTSIRMTPSKCAPGRHWC